MATARRGAAADEAWKVLHRLFQDSRDRWTAVAAEHELSPPQLTALRALQPGEPMPMSGLAGLMRCDNSNVTGIIDRLEDRGLVQRRPAAHDRRVKHLVLTEAGVALRERLGAELDEAPEPLRRLSEAEQRQLLDLVRKAVG